TLNNLADLYHTQKKYNEAEKLYKEALDIILEVLGDKHPAYGIFLNNLASLQQDKGDYKQSEKLYLENLEKTKASLGDKDPNYASSLTNLGSLYEHMGRYQEAEKLYIEALQIFKNAFKDGGRHPSYTLTIGSLARLNTALKNYDVADTLWERTLDNYLYEIQTLFPQRSEKDKEKFYAQMSHELNTYNTYAILRANANPKVLERMYDNQLATKALLLNSSNKMRHRILASKDSALVKMFKQWLTQKEILSKAYSLSNEELEAQHINIDSIVKSANDLERKLTVRSEEFRESDVDFYSWKDVKKHLSHDEAAIEIIRFIKYKFDSAGTYTDSVYYAALIIKNTTQNHPELILLKNGNKMEAKQLTIYKNSVRYKVEDKNSYNYFWKNIHEKLTDIKKVYISPDGVYNQINVNTLKNPNTNKYTLDEMEVRLVTNTKDLVAKKEIINTKKQIVLFGNPDYDLPSALGTATTVNPEDEKKYTPYLNPLQGTEVEVKKITEDISHHGWMSKTFVGATATEKNIKNIASPKVIHIATHGFFEKDDDISKKDENKQGKNPLLKSGLMLAGASVTLYNREHHIFNSENIETKQEDGILTAFEVINLNLDHTDLVVLSACETGLGEVKNGEGVYGLQRAFIIAGAQSLIISLWKVDDATTQKLMTIFYREWVKTGNKNLAFKRAQTKLKEEFPDPYYWGAFIMVQ
ncbi:MAG: CHAT domain-containing protein, partial [Cytophagaceae bacterium]|nr:CHAT domain-containing protein [Cytophagaceae bacterium]